MLRKQFIIAILMLAGLSACSKATLPSDAEIKDAISQSQDYSQHKEVFMAATKKLLKRGCAFRYIQRVGGWMRATAKYRDEPVYYSYCGMIHRDNRIYLNAKTGKILK